MPDMPVAQAITSLELTVAFNKSDSTFGWNGFNRGLMLYYLSQGSKLSLQPGAVWRVVEPCCSENETYVSREHGYPLVDGLTPSVSFALVETRYKGKPFTSKTQIFCDSNKAGCLIPMVVFSILPFSILPAEFDQMTIVKTHLTW